MPHPRPVSALALALLCAAPACGSLLAAAGQARQQALESEWQRELEPDTRAPETKVVPYKSPVKRVVLLLQKMKAELEQEADSESAMYDKMVCWCETNEKEKTQAVKDAEARDLDLSAEAESRSARYGKLATEIKNLKKQIAEDTAALEQARAMRERGASEFRDEEKDMVQIIDNLRNAIAVLAKHHGGTLLQLDAPLVSGLRVLLRSAALKREVLLADGAAKGTALLSVGEAGERSQAGGLDAALLSALDVHGGEVPDDLPLKYAAQVVARSAGTAGAAARPGCGANGAAELRRHSCLHAARGGVMDKIVHQEEDDDADDEEEESSLFPSAAAAFAVDGDGCCCCVCWSIIIAGCIFMEGCMLGGIIPGRNCCGPLLLGPIEPGC